MLIRWDGMDEGQRFWRSWKKQSKIKKFLKMKKKKKKSDNRRRMAIMGKIYKETQRRWMVCI